MCLSKNLKQGQLKLTQDNLGSGCGSVRRAIDSGTKDPRFESMHGQILFTINCIINCSGETKIKKKRPGMAQFLT